MAQEGGFALLTEENYEQTSYISRPEIKKSFFLFIDPANPGLLTINVVFAIGATIMLLFSHLLLVYIWGIFSVFSLILAFYAYACCSREKSLAVGYFQCFSLMMTVATILIAVILSTKSYRELDLSFQFPKNNTAPIIPFAKMDSFSLQPQLMSSPFIPHAFDLNFISIPKNLDMSSIKVDPSLCATKLLKKKTSSDCSGAGFRIALLANFYAIEYGNPFEYSVNLCNETTRSFFFPQYNSIYDGYFCAFGNSKNILDFISNTVKLHNSKLFENHYIQFLIQQINITDISEDGYLPGEQPSVKWTVNGEGNMLQKKSGKNIRQTKSIPSNFNGYAFFKKKSKFKYLHYGGVFVRSIQGNVVPLPGASISKMLNKTLDQALQVFSNKEGLFTNYYYSIPLSHEILQTITEITYPNLISKTIIGYIGGLNLMVFNYRIWEGAIILESPLGAPCYDESTNIFSCESKSTFYFESNFCFFLADELTPIAQVEATLIKSLNFVSQIPYATARTDSNGCVSFLALPADEYQCNLNGYLKTNFPISVNSNINIFTYTFPIENNDNILLFTLEWDDPTVVFSLAFTVYNPSTNSTFSISNSSLTGDGIKMISSSSVSNKNIVVLNKYLTAYYFLSVVSEPSTSKEIFSNSNLFGLRLNIHQTNIEEPLLTFQQPFTFMNGDEWAIGCFHGGGLEYFRGINKINDGNINYVGCQKMYTDVDNMESYFSKKAEMLCNADFQKGCIYDYSDQSEEIWDNFQVDMVGKVVEGYDKIYTKTKKKKD